MQISDTPDAKPKNDDERRSIKSPFAILYRLPWWLVILLVLWVAVVISIIQDPDYNQIFKQLSAGIGLTLYLALTSYIGAMIIGLLVGLVRSYRPTAPEPGVSIWKTIQHILYAALYNLLTVFVEFMRGIPPLVFLLIVGFIIVPVLNDNLVNLLRSLGATDVPDNVWKGRDPATAIAGLSLVYGAFLSEVFRSGIQSIPKGQMEAAKSLGMTFFQAMRHIVIPQAVRRILPELGNNFISMIKDTSLVTILGTTEITQIARQWSGSTFKYLQTYAVLSLIYLTLTVGGSMLVQGLEAYLRVESVNTVKAKRGLWIRDGWAAMMGSNEKAK